MVSFLVSVGSIYHGIYIQCRRCINNKYYVKHVEIVAKETCRLFGSKKNLKKIGYTYTKLIHGSLSTAKSEKKPVPNMSVPCPLLVKCSLLKNFHLLLHL